MSEYQYHEFRTVNRALTRDEIATVNTWSSRGTVTSTSAEFVHNYSSFRHDAEKCLLGFFDMMLYLSNYGSRRVMFRFPEKMVDFDALKKYEWRLETDHEHSLKVYKKAGFVLVDIHENLEEGYEDWLEGEGILGGLTSLWTDIAAGNYACLYMAWAGFAAWRQAILDNMDEDDFDDDESDDPALPEPPVPAGLRKPSSALSGFMDFWGISDHLLEAAAENAPKNTALPIESLEKLLEKITAAEKNEWLARILRDEPHTRTELVKRLQKLAGQPDEKPVGKRRGIAEILKIEEQLENKHAEKLKIQAAEKRFHELEAMKNREPQMWKAVETNLLNKLAAVTTTR